jgi:hypothetical protein
MTLFQWFLCDLAFFSIFTYFGIKLMNMRAKRRAKK